MTERGHLTQKRQRLVAGVDGLAHAETRLQGLCADQTRMVGRNRELGAQCVLFYKPSLGTVVAPLIDVVVSLAAVGELGVDPQRIAEIVLGTGEQVDLFDIVVEQPAGVVKKAVVVRPPTGGSRRVVGHFHRGVQHKRLIVYEPTRIKRVAEGRVAAVRIDVSGAAPRVAIFQGFVGFEPVARFVRDVGVRQEGVELRRDVDDLNQILLVKLHGHDDARVIVTGAEDP